MSNIQYTIRNIPPAIDQAIRKQSKRTGKSLNQIVVELLTLQTLGTTDLENNTTFSWLYNRNTLDKSFDDAVSKLSGVDEKLWK